MDGNGRWAEKRNLPKIMGHRAGARRVEEIIEICAKKGIKALTLYTFSSENWKRPKPEVDSLMALLEENLRNEWKKLHENNIRFNAIGRIYQLPAKLVRELERVMDLTRDNDGLILTLALNYGGRQEIVDAVLKICELSKENTELTGNLDEAGFGRFLYTGDLPQLDLIIRTSGEMRLSNFLLWQAAYAELFVTDVLWPDFGADEFEKALDTFLLRERRFGG